MFKPTNPPFVFRRVASAVPDVPLCTSVWNSSLGTRFVCSSRRRYHQANTKLELRRPASTPGEKRVRADLQDTHSTAGMYRTALPRRAPRPAPPPHEHVEMAGRGALGTLNEKDQRVIFCNRAPRLSNMAARIRGRPQSAIT